MFERNRIDNADASAQAVALVLDDGRTLKGRLAVGAGRTLAETLNSTTTFLDFEPYGADRCLIAKGCVREARSLDAPLPSHLGGRLRDAQGFDPLAILGLTPGAGFDAIRAAYHKLALIYHPDRYASTDLPSEVREYLDAMARRINAAYEALEQAPQGPRAAPAHRPAPVYTSPTRR